LNSDLLAWEAIVPFRCYGGGRHCFCQKEPEIIFKLEATLNWALQDVQELDSTNARGHHQPAVEVGCHMQSRD
jgi:hypothetical protein